MFWGDAVKVAAAQVRQAGFAAVDALMALTILAMTMALAFQAMISARGLAERAAETRRAAALLQYLMDSDIGTIGERAGMTDRFSWKLAVSLVPADPAAPAVRSCDRSAEVRALRSQRRYRLSTTEFCLPPARMSS